MNKKRNILYASLGGILEFYDFILFIFFINVFSKIFFPPKDPFWMSVYTYVAFGAGYLARPIGAIIMSHFGDIIGRKKIFYISMLFMVIPSFALAFMPTYESIGLLATIILFLIRIIQGFSIGVEVSGAWIFVSEFVNSKNKAFVLGFISSTLTIGLLLGNISTLILNHYFTENEIYNYAWRIPFVVAGIFGIFIVFIRKTLNETPEFIKIKNEKNILSFPLKQAFKTHKTSMFICFLMSIVLTSGMITLMFLPKYFIELLYIDNNKTLLYQNMAIVAIIFGAFIQGCLASIFNPYSICFIFSLLFAIFSFCFSFYDENFIYYYLLACFCQGIITFAPLFMTSIFETNLRFSALSFAYNVSYAILSFLIAFVINFIYKDYIGYYLVFVGLVCISSIYFVKKIKPNLY